MNKQISNGMKLEAQIREIKGKKVNSLRKEDKIPAILYGWKEKESKPLVINLKQFKKLWREAGESGVVELKVGDENKNVLIQDVQINPIDNEPIHVDFFAVDMDKSVVVSVPFLFEGESPIVKSGGILVKVMHEVEVEALPKDLPSEIIVNISKLVSFEDKITVADLSVSEGVKINADPEETIALVEEPREEEEIKETLSIEDIEVTGEKKKEDGSAEGEAAGEKVEEEKKEKGEQTSV